MTAKPPRDRRASGPRPVGVAGPGPAPDPGPANIADPFWDLLQLLDERRRRGFIRRLAVGYYEDWRPTRAEVAFLVDVELGRRTIDDSPATAMQPNDVPGLPGLEAVDDSDEDRVFSPSGRPQLRAAADPPDAARAKQRPSPLATFAVDCGVLATPFRFIASGLSSAGWTVRLGNPYRRAFLHYRLVSAGRTAPAPSRSIRPMLFAGEITCIPDISAPYAADDGRAGNHSPRATAVLGSRGPWPIAQGVTLIDFLITAQPQPGNPHRHQPAGSLRVNLRSGTAMWRTAGLDDAGAETAAAR